MKKYFSVILRSFVLMFTIVFLLNIYSARGSNISASGTIVAPSTWSADTVHVTGNIQVSNGIILTINPGVKVIFNGHYSIDVQGSIRALGTADQPILFTMSDTTGFANLSAATGGWAGIRFDSTLSVNDSSVFNYCHFRYGKAVGTGDLSYGGALYIYYFNKIAICNSIFEYCRATNDGGAIYLKNSGALISRNLFTHGQGSRGGGVFCDNSWPRIELNCFRLNYATSMGGGICCANSSAPSIANNLFHNNLAYLGGGVAFFNAGNMTKLVSNTIAFNRANYGGGMSSIATDPSFSNTIFWGNAAAEGHEITLLDPDSDPNFNYCDIQGGISGIGGSGAGAAYSGTYTNNIDAYPEFADTLAADLQIKTISPCLDAGAPDTTGLHITLTDLASNPRINMGRIDIGAYERQQVVNFCGNISQNTLWNADTVKVNCDITVAPGVTLTIAPGVFVQMQGSYALNVQGALVASGNTGSQIFFDTRVPLTGWKGIRIKANASQDSTLLNYCSIQHVINSVAGTFGAIGIDSTSKIRISNTFIANNSGHDGAGLSLDHASPLLTNDVFANNNAMGTTGKGGAIYAINGSAPVMNEVIMTANNGVNGGAMYFFLSSMEASNLKLSNNNAVQEGAGFYSDSSHLNLRNSLLVNNQSINSGAACYINRSEVHLINSDLINNLTIHVKGSVYVAKSNVSFTNSILYGNKNNDVSLNDEVYVNDTLSITNFSHCDVEGDTTAFSFGPITSFNGLYINNKDINPLFINPTTVAGTSQNGILANWALQGCTPVYNGGTPNVSGLGLPSLDCGGFPRISGDTIDMGAYELKKPALILQPHDTAVCEGNTVIFSVEAQSSIAVSYQWQIKPSGSSSFGNAGGPGATTPAYTVAAVASTMNGDQYQCVITADCSTGNTSAIAHLTVNTVPVIQAQPLSLSVCQGNPASFNVTATGSGLTYQWQQRPYGSATWSNCAGTSAITPTYSIPSTPSALNNYSYRCIINGSCLPGDTTAIADLTVKSLPAVVTHPANQSVCIGENAGFSVSGNGTGISYQWQESTDGGTTWSNMTGNVSTSINLTSVTYSMNGYKYHCVISGDCSPSATSNAATLTVNMPPQITQQPQTTEACVYSNVTIPVVATGGNLAFQWQQKAPSDAVWSNAPGLSALTSDYQIMNVTLLMTGNKYRCLISGSCPPNIMTDSVMLFVHNLPNFYAGPDTTMLLSHTIVLDAGPGYSSYAWSTGETTQTIDVVGTTVGVGAHNYSCTITDANGCSNNDALIVTVLDDTGLEGPQTGNSLVIYPNPAADKVFIEPGTQKIREARIQIYNLPGEKISEICINQPVSSVIELNTQSLKPGTYFIQIVTDDQILTRKLNIVK